MGYYYMNDDIKEQHGNMCEICKEEIQDTFPFYFMGSFDKLAHSSCYIEYVEETQRINNLIDNQEN